MCIAGEDSCCPDGFDCVLLTLTGTRAKCKWTGRPIVPPAGFLPKPNQMTPNVAQAAASRPAPQLLLGPGVDSVEIVGAFDEQGGRRHLSQATCATGYLCSPTTLVQAGQPTCNRGGTQLRGWGVVTNFALKQCKVFSLVPQY